MNTALARPRWRSTLNYRPHPRLQVGVEYNPDAGEIGPLLTWFLVTEGERLPALFVGTSSDRIGSPEGTQSYYLTAAKHHPAWPVSAYVSLNYSEWDGDVNFDEEHARVAKFAEKRKPGYPIYLDATTTPAWSTFHVRSIPAAFLVDTQGRIVQQWLGKVDIREVERAVAKLVG